MEGLEISVVKLSEVISNDIFFRIDAEFYKKSTIKLENNLLKKQSRKFDFFIKEITDGKHGGVDFKDSGVIFLRNTNIKENYIDISDKKYISESECNQTPRAVIKENDILLATIGSVGDSVIVPKDFPKATINQNLVRIEVKNINPFFVSIFLNSKYGRIQTKKLAAGNVYTMINYPNLKTINIPVFSDSFQSQIESIVKSAHAKLEESKSLYSQAEDLLLNELGLKGWQPKNTLHTTKKFSDFAQSGRLDAEYYQPKYDEIERELSKKNTLEISKVGQICDKNFTPLDNIEYKYIELADIGTFGEITSCTTAFGYELPSRARRIVHKGDVLISSIEGSLQSCAIVPKEFDNALCSTGFYVMIPNKINAETLLILLKSEVIQLLLKKGCSGTILTNISKDEFLKIKIPILPESIQTKIASLIQQSFECKAQSKQLLEDAKRMVESEIEKN